MLCQWPFQSFRAEAKTKENMRTSTKLKVCGRTVTDWGQEEEKESRVRNLMVRAGLIDRGCESGFNRSLGV